MFPALVLLAYTCTPSLGSWRHTLSITSAQGSLLDWQTCRTFLLQGLPDRCCGLCDAADSKSGQVSHSTVEKQRRDRINSLIDEVGCCRHFCILKGHPHCSRHLLHYASPDHFENAIWLLLCS